MSDESIEMVEFSPGPIDSVDLNPTSKDSLDLAVFSSSQGSGTQTF